MAADILRRHRRRRADYVTVFTSEAGQRVLSDLFRFCHMDEPCFAADPCITAFNEGQRRVFLRILGLLRLTDQDIVQLARKTEND
jgi:hypothetical protein